MNEREQDVAERLRNHGFEVYRDGWPDLLVVDPYTGKGIGVELKYGQHPDDEQLSPGQITMHRALRRLGLQTVVVGYTSPLPDHWARVGLPEHVL